MFGGAADRENFEQQDDYTPQFIPPKIYSEKEQTKHSFYKEIRSLRESKLDQDRLKKIFETYLKLYPEQWLMAVEIYELAVAYKYKELESKIKQHLIALKEKNPKTAMLIDDGLKVAEL